MTIEVPASRQRASSAPADNRRSSAQGVMAISKILVLVDDAPISPKSIHGVGEVVEAPVASPAVSDSRESSPLTDPDATMVEGTSAHTDLDKVEDTSPETDMDKAEENGFIPLEDREFICCNDDFSICQTGQVTLDVARKTISHHFGRNKTCTKMIGIWPLLCRKHYQRATYKQDLWQLRKIELIIRQFFKIDEILPRITYKICLKKSEDERLSQYARLIDQGNTHDQASASVQVNPRVKSFQAPINVLREIADYLGPNQDQATCVRLMKLILDMVEKKETAQVPQVEFLMEHEELEKKNGTATSTPTSKTTSKKGTRKGKAAGKATKGCGSRISTKGAVQKPVKA
ncbi:hypothetical protein BU24DRAFT_469672 [Aaosphaeria arxii CBS 175.79]|uniref:Uncharacterized protein n=1 Tax=Aaosphaeria arxii CBS 175.79 TaxID=1450172 RepID=A0A6A5Y6R8_9PLEO|nr:uncharacterized protein BU24DRAFT_469672 [Aaosphaeria arxii CBS 175.79]KAF2020913.1 hypothetical protein BU24DRAFT_469672 [Aaosphaeria arxii CBS 175.79]